MPFVGEISALTTALLWGITSLLFASVVRHTGPVQLNINRMILAIGWLLMTVLAFGIPFHVSRTQILYLVLSGAAELVFCDTFLYKAYQTMGARITVVIMASGPAFNTVLAYIFLHEIISGWAVIGILVTLGGIILVVSDRRKMPAAHPAFSMQGLLWATLAVLGQGSGMIFAKQAFLEGPIHGFAAALIRMVAGLLLLWPVALLTRHYSNPFRVFRHQRKLLVPLLIGSILGPFWGIALSLVAIANAPVGIASTLLAMSPVMMLPLVKIFHQEVLSWQAIVGAFVAVSGVALLFLCGG